jgi:outer membrane receptor protein involved in Fe transport
MRSLLVAAASAAVVVALAAEPARAQDTAPAPGPASPEATLPPVVVTAPLPVSASSELFIPGKDFELRPQGRPADVLRLVPGLIIGQHAGGGKSEQYFLRGFDADHGTDVALFVDGVPVNLRSHAHGQGYADLHFLIPETVQRLEAFKGPYHTEYGDFATAGAFNFVTLDVVTENIAQAAGGSFGTQRYLTLLSPTRDRIKTLFAAEVYVTDGPFERDQNYRRLNLFGKASGRLGADTDFSVTASYLRSSWFASGQVPRRAVESDLIDRFGAIDNSEGGSTQRAIVNGMLRWMPSEDEQAWVRGWAQYYTLDLFSNFTFFLTDPVNGDGIEQVDGRWVAGLEAAYQRTVRPWGIPVTGTGGVQVRMDRARVILATQADRHRLGRTQDVDVHEVSYSPYVKFDLTPLSWLRIVTGARGDIFTYDVHSNLDDGGSGNVTRAIPSVKANVILGPFLRTELFGNFGTGFHSNDARAVIANPDLPALARARGYEGGIKSRPHPRVEVSATYWVLDLQSELVFVGDEGTTEARGPSHRKGWEFAARVRLADWLFFGGDVTVSRARFDNGDEVPLAPRLTARAELTARWDWGLSATMGLRVLGDRFATEDRQETALGYTLFDLSARYRWKALEVFASIENLLNVDFRETQFFFTSRLRNEPAAGVNDMHYTPGNPRTFLGGLAVRF